MDETKVTQMLAYFHCRIQACREQERALAADLRHDEAVFVRVRGNVFDIFRAVFSAALKTQTDAAAAGWFFREKLGAIAKNWAHGLEKAQVHGDAERSCLEEWKLEAAREIRARFGAIWEGEV